MEEKLTHTLEDLARWKNYAEDLKKERDGWIAEYRAARAEIERLKKEQYRRADQESFNDGKSSEYRDPDMPSRNSGWSV